MSQILKTNLSTERVAEAALGKDDALPRSHAISLLPATNPGQAGPLLRQILQNAAEAPKFRRLAATALWRLNTPEARETLLAASRTEKDPSALGGVVKALGRVGDERALAALGEVQMRAEGFLAEQAAFASALIAYRLGLPGRDLEIPQKTEGVPRSPRGRIELGAPAAEEAARFAQALRDEPYDVPLADDSVRQVRCSAGLWMLSLSKSFVKAGSLAALRQRKTVAGLLASRSPVGESYSVAYLLLTSPSPNGEHADLLITRTTGEPAWAGTLAESPEGGLHFTIHTVGRIGIVAVELVGTWSSERGIRLTRAVSATRVIEKLAPVAIAPPAQFATP